ncbi:hypothetical protein [Endozoicomonas arenosclerae]|uniref:hypothetical protein n=1 Tax=Endozoicomonas arenosclerae TaxID=1633495 RepID=UPI000780C0C9|nr:hypothetical protein [Endozoicomonas arenosclerae]
MENTDDAGHQEDKEGVFAQKSVKAMDVLPELPEGAHETSGTRALPERSIQEAPAVKQLVTTLQKSTTLVQNDESTLLSSLIDAPAIQRLIETGKEIPSSSLERLEQALPELNTLILQGSTPANLHWRIDSLLSEPLAMDQLSSLKQLLQNTCIHLAETNQPDTNPELAESIKTLNAALARQDLPAKDQCGLICKAMDKVADHLSDPNDKELFSILRRQVRDVTLQCLKEAFSQRLRDVMSDMEKGGSAREVAVAIELGLAASALGLDALGASVKLEYIFTAKTQDDTRISDEHAFNTQLSLTIGNNAIARADASLSGSIRKGKLFSGLEEHIQHHANDLLPMLFNNQSRKSHSRVKTLKGIVTTRHADRNEAQVRAEQERLQTLLHAKGILPSHQHLTRPEQSQRNYLDTRSWQVKGSAGVTALEGMLSGEFHVSNTHSEFFQKYPRLSAMKASPEKLNQEPDRYFSVHKPGQWLQGKEGRQWINKVKADVEQLKKDYSACRDSDPEEAEAVSLLIEIYRSHLSQSMASLYAEFDHYCSVTNQLDSNAHPDLRSDVRDIKHRLEAARGAKNRGEYIRAIIDTHVALASIYRDSLEESVPPEPRDYQFARLLEKFEQDYEKPRLALNENRHTRGHLSAFNKATSHDIEAGGEIKVVVGPAEVKGYFTINDVRKHFNPDTEGRYLNVGFTAGIGTNPQSALTAAVGGLPSSVTQSGHLFLDSLPESFAYGIHGNLKMEVNFIWSHGNWRVQYIRASNQTGIGGGTPELTIPAAPGLGVVMKAEAAVRSVNNIWERVGTNTLTYFYTRYNGWAMAGKVPEYWNTFKSSNSDRLKDLFKNLARPDSNVRKEFQETLREINVETFSDALQKAINEYAESPDDAHLQSALNLFDEFMTRQHQVHLDMVKNRFKPV